MFDPIFDFFNAIYEFISSGIYSFAVDAFKAFVEYSTLAMIKSSIWSLGFAWDVAKGILQDLNLSSHIQSAWSSMPSAASGALAYFRVPEVINNLATGVVMRYVMRFLPFM
jgi:hypothetical protein